MDHLEEAWAELHAANDAMRWFVGPMTFEERLAGLVFANNPRWTGDVVVHRRVAACQRRPAGGTVVGQTLVEGHFQRRAGGAAPLLGELLQERGAVRVYVQVAVGV